VIPAAFVALVALIVFIERKRLARLQGGILGGSIFPGCVVIQAVALLLIAIAMVVFRQ
jgi:hypothetical protein